MFDDILSSVEGGNLYSVKLVFGSKTFRRSFGLSSKSMASSGGNNGEDAPVSEAALVAGDDGESHHSRDGLIEYIEAIRKKIRKIYLAFLI